jgi:hypothetical protein
MSEFFPWSSSALPDTTKIGVINQKVSLMVM